MTFKEAVDSVLGTLAGIAVGPGLTEGTARTGAAAGAAAGTPGSPGQKAAAALEQLGKPAPVAPGEAVKETALSAVGLGPIAGNLRAFWIWVVIVLVGLIGLWGLLAPGGGVAVIERARR